MPDALVRWMMRLGFPAGRCVRRKLGLAYGGASLAVRTPDDLLVIRHSYRPGLDFPGGGLNSAAEDPCDAAVREAREELSLAVAANELRYLGVARRGFGGVQDWNHVFELRCNTLPQVEVDKREVVWAGSLAQSGASRADLQLPVRWYLRHHGRDLDLGPC